jgi:alpha-glucosidase
MRARLFLLILFAQLGLAALAQHPAASIAEQNVQTGLPANGATAVFSSVTDSRALSNGFEIRSGQAVMQVTALRDDVLRIRAGAAGTLPEDASWAVVAATRETHVAVEPHDDTKAVGFRTKLLDVSIDRATASLVISDLKGNVISSDALGHSTSFENGSFRVWKTLPANEHFFGLGEKTGPLDRREQAFSMWNTDAFGFQESTDPI